MINRMRAKMRLNALERILEEERTLLLAGDIDKIGNHTAKKEEAIRLIESLEESTAATLKPSIEAIQRKAERNITLMEAAKIGLAEASNLMAELEQQQGTLKVYGDAGQAHSLAGR